MAQSGRDQNWRDLCEALRRESDAIGGYGRLSVEIVFHGGEPQEVHVHERVPRYRLGTAKPPLTGQSPLATLLPTE